VSTCRSGSSPRIETERGIPGHQSICRQRETHPASRDKGANRPGRKICRTTAETHRAPGSIRRGIRCRAISIKGTGCKSGGNAAGGAVHTRNSLSTPFRAGSRVSGEVRSPCTGSTCTGRRAAPGLPVIARTGTPGRSIGRQLWRSLLRWAGIRERQRAAFAVCVSSVRTAEEVSCRHISERRLA
jgi:hypothetical protein